MTITVKIKNGRLVIHEGSRLVVDKGGEFVDAITDGNSIIALLKSGRVQELRADGRFDRDIVGGGAVSIKLSGDIVVVRTSNGRFDQYKNGKRILSSGMTPSTKKASNKSEAEKLGEKAGEALFDALENLIRFSYKKLKEKFLNK